MNSVGDGAVLRALSSHQCGLTSIPARCRMWVEFVVGFRLAPRIFFPGPRDSSLHKNQHYKFQSVEQDIGIAGKPDKADLPFSLRLIEGIVRLFHKNLLVLSSNKTAINVTAFGNVLITAKTLGYF